VDDGKCHICRQWPLEQSPLYTITTCRDCDVTAACQPATWAARLDKVLDAFFARHVKLFGSK
jgi:hypothetical protein